MTKKTTKGNDDYTLEERGTALLGLGLRDAPSNSQIIEPTDQDLVALLNKRLPQQKRARVLHAIANDRDVYGRWLSLVELNHLEKTEEQIDATPVAVPTRSKSQTTQVVSWGQQLQNWLRPVLIPAGVFAAAMAVFMMVFPQSQSLNNEVTALYRDFSEGAANQLARAESLPTRSALGWGLEPESNYTADRTVLAQGIVAGLAALNDEAKISGTTIESRRYSETGALPESDRAALFELGRLAVLTHAQCQQSEAQDFHSRAQRLFDEAAKQVLPSAYPALKGLNAVYRNGSEGTKSLPKSDTCALALNLVGQFASE